MVTRTHGRGTLRITSDPERCCGAGNCAMTAPAVFDQREDDGVVVVLDDMPPASEHAGVRAAVAACPTGAIRVAGQDGRP